MLTKVNLNTTNTFLAKFIDYIYLYGKIGTCLPIYAIKGIFINYSLTF